MEYTSYLRGGQPALGSRIVCKYSRGLHDQGHQEVGERRQEASLVDAVVENVWGKKEVSIYNFMYSAVHICI